VYGIRRLKVWQLRGEGFNLKPPVKYKTPEEKMLLAPDTLLDKAEVMGGPEVSSHYTVMGKSRAGGNQVIPDLVGCRDGAVQLYICICTSNRRICVDVGIPRLQNVLCKSTAFYVSTVIRQIRILFHDHNVVNAD
jgi:hypothetical protein